MIYVKTIIKFLPELIDLIKFLSSGVSDAAVFINLKIKFKAITYALKEKDRIKAARKLNEVFRD